MKFELIPRKLAKIWITPYIINPLARILIALHVSPNVLTLLGLAIVIASSYVLTTGQFLLGGTIMLFGASTDILDGAVARLSNKVTRFGAFFDSLADRLGEAAVFFGLLIYYLEAAHSFGVILTFAVVIASFMVSYSRARAEGLGIQSDVGFMGRPERIVILGFGLVLGYPLYSLGILLVLTSITVLHRILHVAQETRNP
jgi:CDP-diacylglycerol--glycerol-3-phosphate 3-phosphatidyltransferase